MLSIKELQNKPVQIDTEAVGIAAKHAQVRLTVGDYAELFGIDRSTYFRWLKSAQDQRKGVAHPNLRVYGPERIGEIVSLLKRHPDQTPDEILAEELYPPEDEPEARGRYICSRSTMYRAMRKYGLVNRQRHGGAGLRHNFNRNQLSATGPDQVWCWDITYLYTSIEGEYYYLYAAIDLYSRKIVHYEVHTRQSDSLAASFLEHALQREHIAIAGHLQASGLATTDVVIQDRLTLHSDNGAPMKGRNMLAKMQDLGVEASYSRPHVSNDNAFMESSFATLKHSHSVPIPRCFDSVQQANAWMDKFYSWYNNEHRHSGINFITPDQCHRGLGPMLMDKANEARDAAAAELGLHHPLKHIHLPKEVKLMSFSIKRNKLINRVRATEYKTGSRRTA